MHQVFFTLAFLFVVASGNQFLEPRDHVHEKDIQASLLAEVEATSGPGSASSRVRLLETLLTPMYAALPKNQHGNLVNSTVRYALNRLFILRHGWHIRGLDQQTPSSNITSTAGVLKDHVAAYIQDIFEQRLGDKGVGLQELAVMAATMEQLIHKETVGKLGEAYGINDILPTETVNQKQANKLLDTYMAGFIIGQNITRLNSFSIGLFLDKMPILFRSWDDTKTLVRSIRSNVTGDPSDFDFGMLARVAEVVGEEFGTFQDTECRQLKNFLIKSESRVAGRVRLADFYKIGLESREGWQFEESTAYLRMLGSLDESVPNDPSIIIPNYLYSRSNCVASSGYYAVCCKNECEGLFGHIEQKIISSEATPSEIIPIIENLPSSTVKSPRQLTPTLMKRLDEISSKHGGIVPLHGRLFAQWMHLAYPRECPYPHLSGTTSQMKDREFDVKSGSSALATQEEMLQIASQATDSMSGEEEYDENGECSLWSPEEELLVERSTALEQPRSPFAILRPVVLVALIGALATSLAKSFKSASMAGDSVGYEKIFV
jgi:hypothetical protein